MQRIDKEDLHMDAVSTLLRYLKSKHFINDITKAMSEVSTETITLKNADDRFIRDAITGHGTILKEDIEHHYYITTMKAGIFSNMLTQAIILRDGNSASITVYAHEGLIKQHLAEKTIQKLKTILC